MAPEQIFGRGVDRRADVYSAAVIMWELLAGRRLFTNASFQLLLEGKRPELVERPSLERDEVSDALDAIVLHGLQLDPDRRFGSAREMALAIEQFGPLATPSEVGAWVEHTASTMLSERSIKIAEYESSSRRGTELESAPPVSVEVANADAPVPDLELESASDAFGPEPGTVPAGAVVEVKRSTLRRRRSVFIMGMAFVATLAVAPFAARFVGGGENAHVQAAALPTAEELPPPAGATWKSDGGISAPRK
jgi:serine/threonine-protein kinase